MRKIKLIHILLFSFTVTTMVPLGITPQQYQGRKP